MREQWGGTEAKSRGEGSRTVLLVLQENGGRWQEVSSVSGEGQVMKGFVCWAAASEFDCQRELPKTFQQGCDVVRFVF